MASRAGGVNRARGGVRTHTPPEGLGGLSPLRLPVPPPGPEPSRGHGCERRTVRGPPGGSRHVAGGHHSERRTRRRRRGGSGRRAGNRRAGAARPVAFLARGPVALERPPPRGRPGGPRPRPPPRGPCECGRRRVPPGGWRPPHPRSCPPPRPTRADHGAAPRPSPCPTCGGEGNARRPGAGEGSGTRARPAHVDGHLPEQAGGGGEPQGRGFHALHPPHRLGQWHHLDARARGRDQGPWVPRTGRRYTGAMPRPDIDGEDDVAGSCGRSTGRPSPTRCSGRSSTPPASTGRCTSPASLVVGTRAARGRRAGGEHGAGPPEGRRAPRLRRGGAGPMGRAVHRDRRGPFRRTGGGPGRPTGRTGGSHPRRPPWPAGTGAAPELAIGPSPPLRPD